MIQNAVSESKIKTSICINREMTKVNKRRKYEKPQILVLGPMEDDTESDTESDPISDISNKKKVKAVIERINGNNLDNPMDMITKTFNYENAGHDKTNIMVILDKDGKAWYRGGDICEILGYVKGRNAISTHVKDKYKISLADITFGPPGSQASLKMDKKTIFLSNSGIFQLVSKSQKPEAEKLWEFITETILPELFTTGTYTMPIKDTDIAELTKSFYDDNMISDFMECPCVYFAYVGRHKIIINGVSKIHDIIKFGETSEISRRDLKEHRKFYEIFNILGIWKTLAPLEVEKKIEKNFESLNVLVNLKIKGMNKKKEENKREHIILTEKHGLKYCLNMIQQVINKTTSPQQNEYLDKIKELEYNNKLLTTKIKYLVKLNHQLEGNVHDLRKKYN